MNVVFSIVIEEHYSVFEVETIKTRNEIKSALFELKTHNIRSLWMKSFVNVNIYDIEFRKTAL